MTKYTVKPGDTLDGISKAHGYSDHKAAGFSNDNISSGDVNLINPGDVIDIPDIVDTTKMRESEESLKKSVTEVEDFKKNNQPIPNNNIPQETKRPQNNIENSNEPKSEEDEYTTELNAMFKDEYERLDRDYKRLSGLTLASLGQNSTIQGLMKELDIKKQEQEQTNRENEAGTTAAFYRRGGFRYQVASAKDVSERVIETGIDKLEAIDEEYQAKIDKVTQDLIEENYKDMEKNRKELSNLRKDFVNISLKLKKDVREERKAKQEFKQKAVKWEWEVKDKIREETTRDLSGFILAQVRSGMDPADVDGIARVYAQQAGYDPRDIDTEQILDLVTSYNKATKAPNTDIKKIGDTTYEIVYNTNGSIKSKRAIYRAPQKRTTGGYTDRQGNIIPSKIKSIAATLDTATEQDISLYLIKNPNATSNDIIRHFANPGGSNTQGSTNTSTNKFTQDVRARLNKTVGLNKIAQASDDLDADDFTSATNSAKVEDFYNKLDNLEAGMRKNGYNDTQIQLHLSNTVKEIESSYTKGNKDREYGFGAGFWMDGEQDFLNPNSEYIKNTVGAPKI